MNYSDKALEKAGTLKNTGNENSGYVSIDWSAHLTQTTGDWTTIPYTIDVPIDNISVNLKDYTASYNYETKSIEERLANIIISYFKKVNNV